MTSKELAAWSALSIGFFVGTFLFWNYNNIFAQIFSIIGIWCFLHIVNVMYKKK